MDPDPQCTYFEQDSVQTARVLHRKYFDILERLPRQQCMTEVASVAVMLSLFESRVSTDSDNMLCKTNIGDKIR